MDDLPEPLVSAEVDLKDFAWTPIYSARLSGSAFHARATDAEWRAGVTLWLKAQDQIPAGSLPNDDIELCRLAELGRDLKTWRKIRDGALRGWRVCSDGRLYNNVVAEVVNDQWDKKRSQRDRTEAARVAKIAKRLSQTILGAQQAPVTEGEAGFVTDVTEPVTTSIGPDRTGQEIESSSLRSEY